MPDDRAQHGINALLDEIHAAWQAGDAEAFAQAFSEDALFVAFNGSRLRGRSAIADFHAPAFATVLRGSRLVIDLVDIRTLSDGIYLVSTSGGPAKPGDKDGVPETQSYLFRDFGERWAIVFFQNTPVRRAR